MMLSRVSLPLIQYLDAVLSAPARAPAAALVARCSSPSSAAVGLCMHGDGSFVHGARNSGGTGGLLLVQRSTSYCLDNSWSDTVKLQGPTRRRRGTKGGVPGPAEDLLLVSEVEAGVNFRPAGGSRGPPRGSFYPIRVTWIRIGHQATNGLDEGVWNHTVGNLGAKGVTLELVCFLRTLITFGWDGSLGEHTRLPGLRQGTTVCSYKYGRGAAVRPQTNNAIWNGATGLWGRVAPFLSLWCGKKDVPTGVNLNRYTGSGSFIRWLSDNEPLFGLQKLPELIVSVSLGNSVEFMVRRRASGNVPLRFGWTMVTFWSWMVWPNRSMNIARRLSCRFLG